MIRFINHTTGSLMWVHESRVEEYRKLGDIPAEELPMPEAPVPEKAEAPEPVPAPARKPERKTARKTAKTAEEEW